MQPPIMLDCEQDKDKRTGQTDGTGAVCGNEPVGDGPETVCRNGNILENDSYKTSEDKDTGEWIQVRNKRRSGDSKKERTSNLSEEPREESWK